MQIPGNMTAAKLKLLDGEEVVQELQGMRKKGIFGNRFGMLYLTNQRLAFVKAIMKAGLVSAALNAKGAKPMLAFSREQLRGNVEKIQLKKLIALQVTHGGKTERFVCDEAGIDQLLATLRG